MTTINGMTEAGMAEKVINAIKKEDWTSFFKATRETNETILNELNKRFVSRALTHSYDTLFVEWSSNNANCGDAIEKNVGIILDDIAVSYQHEPNGKNRHPDYLFNGLVYDCKATLCAINQRKGRNSFEKNGIIYNQHVSNGAIAASIFTQPEKLIDWMKSQNIFVSYTLEPLYKGHFKLWNGRDVEIYEDTPDGICRILKVDILPSFWNLYLAITPRQQFSLKSYTKAEKEDVERYAFKMMDEKINEIIDKVPAIISNVYAINERKGIESVGNVTRI